MTAPDQKHRRSATEISCIKRKTTLPKENKNRASKETANLQTTISQKTTTICCITDLYTHTKVTHPHYQASLDLYFNCFQTPPSVSTLTSKPTSAPAPKQHLLCILHIILHSTRSLDKHLQHLLPPSVEDTLVNIHLLIAFDA